MPNLQSKYVAVTSVISVASILWATNPTGAATNPDCINADPSGVVSSVNGDFEIRADPQDPAGNLIFISNLASGNSSIVAARVSGTTGQFISQTLTTIADNFQGQSIQGPEFVQLPTGQLGVIYAGAGGVHAVFRGQVPASWNDMRYDAAGAPTNGSPPVLAGSSNGSYPTVMPLGQNLYGQYRGSCQGTCYASFAGGVVTDPLPLLNAMGLTPTSANQNPQRDGFVFFGACDANDTCGIYEVKIDTDAGGFVPGTLQMLAEVSESAAQLAAAKHPVTGTTVLFSDGGARTIDVWEQPAAGGPLNLIASVPANKHEHFRAEASNTQVVLHYLSAALLADGSFTIPVSASGGTLIAGASKKISSYGHGAEFAWMPAANKFALFYRGSGNIATRCWVTP